MVADVESYVAEAIDVQGVRDQQAILAAGARQLQPDQLGWIAMISPFASRTTK